MTEAECVRSVWEWEIKPERRSERCDCRTSATRTKNTAFVTPWKPLGRKLVLNPALVVHTNHFCMLLVWIRMRDPAIVANTTLIHVQKPWEHKLTIAAVTPNEWTHSACTVQHTAAEVMSLCSEWMWEDVCFYVSNNMHWRFQRVKLNQPYQRNATFINGVIL